MPRKPRLVVEGEAAVYHVMSRTALDGFVLGDAEKDHLLQLIQHYSAIYFAEILSFCVYPVKFLEDRKPCSTFMYC